MSVLIFISIPDYSTNSLYAVEKYKISTFYNVGLY